MGHHKISKLLNDSTVPMFVTRKWMEINDLSRYQYFDNKNISLKTPMLRSDLCDYSNAYIVVKGRIGVTGIDNAAIRNKKLTCKNNASLKLWISKINNTFIDNAEDLDIVMPIYNLLKSNKNHSMTSGSLWNYFRDEMNDGANENNDAGNYRINNNKKTTSKSFECQTKIIGINKLIIKH